MHPVFVAWFLKYYFYNLIFKNVKQNAYKRIEGFKDFFSSNVLKWYFEEINAKIRIIVQIFYKRFSLLMFFLTLVFFSILFLSKASKICKNFLFPSFIHLRKRERESLVFPILACFFLLKVKWSMIVNHMWKKNKIKHFTGFPHNIGFYP